MENIIKKKLMEKGMTRVELAAKVGVTESAVRHWEKTGIDNLKLSNAKKLANALDTTVIELLNLIPDIDSENLKLARRISNASEKSKDMIDAMLKVEESIDG